MKITYWSYFTKRNGSTVLYDEGAGNSRWLSPALLCVFFFLFLKDLLNYGCAGSSLLHPGFLSLQWVGATLRCSVWVSQCSGFSCCTAQALGTWASVVVSHDMWNLPEPGIKSMPPALAGRFFTTEPPGKPSYVFLYCVVIIQQRRNSFVSDQNKLKTFSLFLG